jgi:hypothetical protein
VLRRVGRCLFMPILVLIAVSCTRLPWAGTPGEGGSLEVVELPSTASVPMELGRLISVTASADRVSFRLWFQNEAGTVHIVGYDEQVRRLWPNARVIHRTGGGAK